MTPVATSPLFIEGGERFIPHIIRIKDIPPDLRASMTEVWDAMMDLNHFNDTLLSDSLTDRVLGQYTGRSGRFVQKGLKGLQDHGIIFRHTEHGRRNIEITGRIAKRKDKPASARGQAQAQEEDDREQLGPQPPDADARRDGGRTGGGGRADRRGDRRAGSRRGALSDRSRGPTPDHDGLGRGGSDRATGAAAGSGPTSSQARQPRARPGRSQDAGRGARTARGQEGTPGPRVGPRPRPGRCG